MHIQLLNSAVTCIKATSGVFAQLSLCRPSVEKTSAYRSANSLQLVCCDAGQISTDGAVRLTRKNDKFHGSSA